MVKGELITKVSEKVEGFKKTQIEEVLKAYGEVVLEGLAKEEEVPVLGVGKFQVKDVAEREAFVNPRQKELGKKKVPAHKAPKFSFGKASKEATK